MNAILAFLFDYRGFNWRQRLSPVELQYAHGRLILATAVIVLAGLAVGLAIRTLVPEASTIRQALIILLMGSGAVAGLYVTFLGFKFAVMRLHDLNRSGWWLAAAIGGSAVATVLMDLVARNLSSFLQLESLFFLAMLIWPGQATVNRFGEAGAYPVRSSRITIAVRMLAFIGWFIGYAGLPALLLWAAFMQGA